jgi:hypothetical protein
MALDVDVGGRDPHVDLLALRGSDLDPPCSTRSTDLRPEASSRLSSRKMVPACRVRKTSRAVAP